MTFVDILEASVIFQAVVKLIMRRSRKFKCKLMP